MNKITLIKLAARPELRDAAVTWFASKWGIPEEAYAESIDEYLLNPSAIPQWYVALNEEGQIIGGVGIIENDYHERKDLSPNVCALLVEDAYRKQGIAKALLDLLREDMGARGYKKLYLLTDHEEFYEKCGWTFDCMVKDEEGLMGRMYVAKTL